MGISYSVFQVPVSQIIGQALPWTLLIVLTSTLISFAIAWVLGMLAALKKGGVFDTLVVGGSFYVQSMPYFFVAMLLLIWFGFELKWFPMSHALPSGLGDSVRGIRWWATSPATRFCRCSRWWWSASRAGWS